MVKRSGQLKKISKIKNIPFKSLIWDKPLSKKLSAPKVKFRLKKKRVRHFEFETEALPPPDIESFENLRPARKGKGKGKGKIITFEERWQKAKRTSLAEKIRRRPKPKFEAFTNALYRNHKGRFMTKKRFNFNLLTRSGNYRPDNSFGIVYSRDERKWKKRFMPASEFFKLSRNSSTDYWLWPELSLKPALRQKRPKIQDRFKRLAIVAIKSGLESFLWTRQFPNEWPDENNPTYPIKQFIEDFGDNNLPGKRRARMDFSTNLFEPGKTEKPPKGYQFVPQIGRTLNPSLANVKAFNYLAIEEGLKIDSTYLFSAVKELLEPLYIHPYNLKIGGKINVAFPAHFDKTYKPFNNIPVVRYNSWLYYRFTNHRFRRAADQIISENFWFGKRGVMHEGFEGIYDGFENARVVPFKNQTSFTFGLSAFRPASIFKTPFVATARVLTIKRKPKIKKTYRRKFFVRKNRNGFKNRTFKFLV